MTKGAARGSGGIARKRKKFRDPLSEADSETNEPEMPIETDRIILWVLWLGMALFILSEIRKGGKTK